MTNNILYSFLSLFALFGKEEQVDKALGDEGFRGSHTAKARQASFYQSEPNELLRTLSGNHHKLQQRAKPRHHRKDLHGFDGFGKQYG